jgi:hypothetical protein
MAAMSRKFLIVGASLMTARSKMRMRRVAGTADRQEKTRVSLVSNLAKTSYWRETGIEPPSCLKPSFGSASHCARMRTLRMLSNGLSGARSMCSGLAAARCTQYRPARP